MGLSYTDNHIIKWHDCIKPRTFPEPRGKASISSLSRIRRNIIFWTPGVTIDIALNLKLYTEHVRRDVTHCTYWYAVFENPTPSIAVAVERPDAVNAMWRDI